MGIPSTPSPSWRTVIRSSAAGGRHRHALSLFILMHGSGHRLDSFSISAALKSCARISSKSLAKSIHSQILKLGFNSDIYSQTALIGFYSKLDCVVTARKLFNEMPVRNVVSWNIILSSYVRAGELELAWKVFNEMPVRDIVSWNSMLSAYAKVRLMGRAEEIFLSMNEKDSTSWNVMMSGYIENGEIGTAREVFDEMPVKNNVSWITMISGYTRSGDVGSARMLFDEMGWRNASCWNAMISGYAQNGCPVEAIHLFNRMRKLESNVMPNEITLSSVISACSQLGNLRFGMWIEEYMRGIGIELDDQLATSLLDFYSKCGDMDRSFELFIGLEKRDLVAYSAMIIGCSVNGRSDEAVCLFEEMLEAKIEPNEVTFVGVLTAYSHAGLVEEARSCFDSMWSEHHVPPSVDHYAIMVDIFGRNGKLDEAYELIQKMPMKPHAAVWGALLLACRLHGNVELAELAAQNSIDLEPNASGYYSLLANIYSENGAWEKAQKIRKMMAEKGLIKMPGCSWS